MRWRNWPIVVAVLVCVCGPPGVAVWAVSRINAERRANILTNCQQQNMRHDKTIAALDGLIADVRVRHPGRYARARESRAGTVLLIDALAPKRDCERLVRLQVHP